MLNYTINKHLYVIEKRLVIAGKPILMQEDDRLIKIIKKYGMKNWTLVSEKLSLGTTTERTGKQCRERYLIPHADGITISTPISTTMLGLNAMTRCSSMRIECTAASGRRSLSFSKAGTSSPTQN